MVKDNAPPHRFGPGYDQFKQYKGKDASLLRDPSRDTHSLGIKPHPHGNSIAKGLLSAARKPRYQEIKPDDVVDLSDGAKFVVLPKEDRRPLIDKVHEATFTNPIGMQWFNDLYGLRTVIRKAHCFYLDDTTSAMVADFSIAIAQDLESVRKMAIPPFPVTWIDVNNVARLDRIRELGGALTPRAAGITEEGPPVDRCGWLIHPADIGGYYMTYFCEVTQGVVSAPLSYWWHCDRPSPHESSMSQDDPFIQGLTFGLAASEINVKPFDAYPSPTKFNIELQNSKVYREQVRGMMQELAGELRHVWGFLLALNAASQFGLDGATQAQPKHTDIRTMPNGKPLLPLEHKTLHLHLKKKWTVTKVTTRAITQHKMRNHDVRGHLRRIKNADGTLKKMVPVKSHERGDRKLGRIEKTYKVEK